jgi:hypothetical protein
MGDSSQVTKIGRDRMENSQRRRLKTQGHALRCKAPGDGERGHVRSSLRSCEGAERRGTV